MWVVALLVRALFVKKVSCSRTIHDLPYGLKSFAKPDMASQNRRKKLRRIIQLSNESTQFIASFCEAMSGFAKLLSPKDELWIVPLLLAVLQGMPVEGLQPVVQQSTVSPSGSRTLRSQTWLRKTTQEVASIGSISV